ncbi:unnamed protein product [Rotaria socialis]|uniref:Uncharacterized protein n=1 Tax=Rotaria socialis TaxID=392032 RepID=A0A821FJL4_9BILA|nr:unnamed protein product [Rotaria socialis]CAF4651547.1 unnamed protein product [Rotaria socialis]
MMITTITSKRHDFDGSSVPGSSFKELSLSSVKVKGPMKTIRNRRWLVAVVGLLASTALIVTVGSVVILFAIHPSTTTSNTTCFTAPSPQPSNAWFSVGNMSTPRYLHASTFISQDNGILITGGLDGTAGLASTERYIPSTGCFRMSSGMSSVRYYHSADAMTSLSSWVVIAGGLTSATISSTADLYDPITETIITINLAFPVYAHSSTKLNEWQLVLIGGVTTTGYVSTGEVLRVGSPSAFISALNTVPVGIVWHTATQLYNNSYLALIVGGTDGSSYYSTVSLYQGTSDTFISLAPAVLLSTPRAYHTATYLSYPINQVLIAGGLSNSVTVLNTFALFDINNIKFVTITATMVTSRYFHTATLLPNGKILVIGGANAVVLSSCELIDPANNFISTSVASLNIARYRHTATLISSSGNDTVLICGGVTFSSVVINSCEIYIA